MIKAGVQKSMINFYSIKEIADFISFDGSIMKQEIEHRKDPLTNVVATINGFLGEKAKAFLGSKDEVFIKDLEEKTKANCPFCVADKGGTRFPESFVEGGYFREGDSICVPNLFSKAMVDAVCIVNFKKHLLNAKAFTGEDFYNVLKNCKRVIERAKACYNISNHILGMNFLHPGGSSMPHPHLQVHIRGVEYSGLKNLMNLSKDYYEKYGKSYWDEIVLSEKVEKKRYIADMDGIDWLVPFSPSHQKEVWGIVRGKGSIYELSDKDLEKLAIGISKVVSFYEDEGNTYTFALLSSPVKDVGDYFSVQVRLCARPALKALYSNFDTWFDPMFVGDDVHTQSPEEYGDKLKKYF